jgi:hypothetical protein
MRSPFVTDGLRLPGLGDPSHARTTPQHSAHQEFVNPGYVADSRQRREHVNVRDCA